MKLNNLPSELLEEIARSTSSARELNNLARSCRRIYSILNEHLYKNDSHYSDNSALDWAVVHTRHETIQRAAATGTNVTSAELGLLHKAATLGRDTIITMLLAMPGCDVDCWDAGGYTPLLRAVEQRRLHTAKLLLEHGADPARPSTGSVYPLNLAIKEGDTAMAMQLLPRVADTSTTSETGWTPLHYAADIGCTALVSELLDRGENLDRLTESQWSPLALAVDNGHLATAKLLLARGASAERHIGDNWPVLDIAADGGHTELMTLLLEHGASASGPSSHPVSHPLHRACAAGHADATELLLRHSADINAPGPSGATPLMEAARGRHTELALRLLSHGADASSQAGDGDGDPGSALHIAAEASLFALIGPLLERGADPNGAGTYGRTALVAAVYEGCPKTVKALLCGGAEPSLVADGDLHPLVIACCRGDIDVTRVLLEHVAAVNPKTDDKQTSLLWASMYGHVEIVRLLLDHGADIEWKDVDEWTALRYAVAHGQAAVLTLLLDRKVRTDVKDSMGRTPAMVALQAGHTKIVELLIDAGCAELEHADMEGRTLLFYAAMRGQSAVVRMLLTYKSDIPLADTHDRYGATPFIVAARNGHEHTLRALGELSSVRIRERDAFGYNALFWALRSGSSAAADAVRELAITMGAEEQEDHNDADSDRVGTTAHIRDAVFDPEACTCDICARCTIGGTRAKRCMPCGGCSFLICSECERLGMTCRDTAHSWEPYECSCRIKDD
ncbi:hypothetical protein PWT90_08737 [Aphanocladium album]|nr:hypothetical protein PWT90_08737 [Aphanocladium album]